MKLEPKEQLGKYPILREIGSGATSRVYLARDPFADREVAIKVFLFDSHADPHTERMLHKSFVAEASLAGKRRLGDERLVQHALGVRVGMGVEQEHLDRHLAVGEWIARQIDAAGGAAADLPQDRVFA